VRSIWQVWQALRGMKPDVTLSFLTRANIANVVASALVRVPAIVSERVNTTSHLGTGAGGKLARLLVRGTYPRARAVIAVSPGVAEDLRASFGVREDRLSVISNPVDGDQIRARAQSGAPVAMDGPYIVAMGRLVPNKNFSMLIDAYARAKIGPKLLILGEGPERPALSHGIAAHGLADRVVLSGFVDNPFPTLHRAVAYVSPSNAEGFPNSLLEAMSLGLPVISTNCLSGPSEVLADMAQADVPANLCFAPHGILVPPSDAAAMAEALRVLDDPARRRLYGEKAARRAADYGVTRAKDAYWSVIRANLPAR
jgi:N-acetylgalactosamine-N,N'-diacetylbacillosaminyl-diphospho-undecaprenol 4-alpha-N-acetylgalactosaminyltransferase